MELELVPTIVRYSERKMLAMALMAIMKSILQNHVYMFNKKLFRQRIGGPIGDNITNLAAQIVMFEFILAYMKFLTRVKLNESIYFLKVMLMIWFQKNQWRVIQTWNRMDWTILQWREINQRSNERDRG